MQIKTRSVAPRSLILDTRSSLCSSLPETVRTSERIAYKRDFWQICLQSTLTWKPTWHQYTGFERKFNHPKWEIQHETCSNLSKFFIGILKYSGVSYPIDWIALASWLNLFRLFWWNLEVIPCCFLRRGPMPTPTRGHCNLEGVLVPFSSCIGWLIQWMSGGNPHDLLLLMAEILHHLIGSLSHYLQGFIHLRWCRIPSTVLQVLGNTSH